METRIDRVRAGAIGPHHALESTMRTRKDYLLAQAMTVAIEAMERLPALYKPESNIVELKEMLDEMCEMWPKDLSQAQFQARRYIDILQGIKP
jgi:hypothetical protein